MGAPDVDAGRATHPGEAPLAGTVARQPGGIRYVVAACSALYQACAVSVW